MTADCHQSRDLAILRPKLLSEELSVVAWMKLI